jgi:trimeric autotransporter adhesin
MAVVAELTVQINGKDAGVDKMLASLEARLKALDAQGQQAGAGMGAGIGKGARQASDSTLALAQAQARLLSTTGQNQAAYTGLNSALGQSTGSAIQLTRAKTQLAQIQNRLSGQSQTLTSLFSGLGGQFSQLGGTAGALSGSIGNLAGSFGTLGAVGAAIGISKAVVDLSVAGANADLLRQRFDSLAVAAGTTGDALIAALRQASGGEISDLNLTLAANKAQLLGVANSAEEFGVLMGIARDRAQQMGISTTQAFNDLTTGLGRGSALILDNLGIIVSVKEANEQYAASLGKTVNALTEAETKQALINQVLAQGKASLDATGGAVTSASGSYAQFGANVSNIASAVGSFLSGGLQPLAAQFNATVDGVKAFDAANTAANAGLFQFINSANVATAGMQAYRDAIQHGATEAQAQAAAELARAAATTTSTAATTAAIGPMQAAAAAQLGQASAAQIAAAATAAATAETQKTAEAAVLAAAQQDIQAQATANLTAQTTAAVSAFLALNPSIDGAGIAAAVAAGKIPALIGQLAQLRVAAYSARDAVAALAAQQAINTRVLAPGGGGVNAPGRTSGRNNDIDAVYELQKANKAAADARSDQIKAIGTDQQKVNQYEKDYAAAVQASGASSASAIQAETQLKQARIAAAKANDKAAKKGGGGGAGGVKLSDQQKLNNQLLASQTQFDQKAEDAEAAHLDRILSINEDFAEKMKDAQEDFAQSRLEGDASFYDALGGVADHGLQQAMSAQYEAAFLEAEEIARTKGADVADAFLKAKEATILAQGKRTAEIAKAEEEGDAGRAEYLRGVDEKYKKAEEARLAAIKAGDDSVAAQHEKALTEEGSKYEAAQEKIGTASDRATQRKIDGSLASGKAIDVEGLKVDTLAAKYDGLATAGARAGVTPTGTGAAGGSTAPLVATAEGNPLLTSMDAIVAAVNAAKEAIVNATRDTTGAVKSLKSSGGIAG